MDSLGQAKVPWFEICIMKQDRSRNEAKSYDDSSRLLFRVLIGSHELLVAVFFLKQSL